MASALAFHPPRPPLYQLKKFRGSGSSASIGDTASIGNDVFQLIRTHKDLPPIDTSSNPRVHMVVVAKNRTRIAVSVYRPTSRQSCILTVIYSHGNATDIGGMHERYKLLSSILQCNVVGYDYTGYGASSGTPEERKTYNDIEAVLRFSQDIGLVTNVADQVILYGQSVGSGPSVWLASRKRVKALIVHSGIASGLRVFTSSRLLCCCDIFPNIDRISKVKAPVFIIHGSDDEEVDVSHGIKLFNALRNPEMSRSWWVAGAGHHDVVQQNFDAYIENLQEFVHGV